MRLAQVVLNYKLPHDTVERVTDYTCADHLVPFPGFAALLPVCLFDSLIWGAVEEVAVYAAGGLEGGHRDGGAVEGSLPMVCSRSLSA
jgi:hypothetical protein